VSERTTLASPFYVDGGTLKPDAPSYVKRQADGELYKRILAGEFCYILTARQTGKSSLMARTAKRLKDRGIRTAIVDLSGIGTEKGKLPREQWYNGLADKIHEDLRCPFDLRDWREAQAKLPPLQRLTKFFGHVAETAPSSAVVFVDEIDSTIRLPFSDDFFAAIRACYNARATDQRFDRITFVLLGAATPMQLIRDPARTPFNIGREIALGDFDKKEARTLAAGLPKKGRDGCMERILYWTDGQPYLTQRVCRALSERSEHNRKSPPDRLVDSIVKDLFLSSAAQRAEANLHYARARLTEGGPEARPLLQLYLRMARGEGIADQPSSPLHAALKLSGVVKADEHGRLRVANRIYEAVFTPEWAAEAMPPEESKALIGSYVEVLNTAVEDYGVAFQAYEKLRRLRGQKKRAEDLLARFWDRRALRWAVQGDRDRALLCRLEALNRADTVTRRKEGRDLIGVDYANLPGTLRHGASVGAVAFSPDGQTVLTGSRDGMEGRLRPAPRPAHAAQRPG